VSLDYSTARKHRRVPSRLVGIILLGISGWLGEEMVYVHGAAVEPRKESEPLQKREEEREFV
jgi:hypothetical protein